MEENKNPKYVPEEETASGLPEFSDPSNPEVSEESENFDESEDADSWDEADADEEAEDGTFDPGQRREEAELERAAKKKKKKIMLIVLAVVTVLGAVGFVLDNYSVQIAGFFQQLTSKKKAGGPTMMYSDTLISYPFVKTNYDLDPTQDEVYMGLDRQLWYKNGAQSVGISLDGTEYDDFSDNSAVRFFVQYFKTVIAGDVETYNTYFTDRYYKTNEPHLRFAPQMLYDIHVVQLSQTANNDGTSTWSFNVDYKIHRNDGTFRNDIPSDGAKKLLFSLVEDRDGTVLIDAIDYYRTK